MRRAGWLLAWLLAWPSWTGAQPPGPEPERVDLAEEEARTVFRAGELAFRDGRFDDAAEHFARAYELSGRPRLLYNLGLSFERLRRDREALDALERYLELEPDAQNRSSIESRMAIMRESLDRRDRPAPPPGVPPPVEPERTASRGRTPIAAIALAGGGVVTAVLAGVFWARANSAHDDLGAGCGATAACTQEDIDDSGGPRYARVTRALVGVTAALGAAAGVALILELRAGGSVEAGAGADGVFVRGTF